MLTTTINQRTTERLFDDSGTVLQAYHDAITGGAEFAEVRNDDNIRVITYRRNGAQNERTRQ